MPSVVTDKEMGDSLADKKKIVKMENSKKGDTMIVHQKKGDSDKKQAEKKMVGEDYPTKQETKKILNVGAKGGNGGKNGVSAVKGGAEATNNKESKGAVRMQSGQSKNAKLEEVKGKKKELVKAKAKESEDEESDSEKSEDSESDSDNDSENESESESEKEEKPASKPLQNKRKEATNEPIEQNKKRKMDSDGKSANSPQQMQAPKHTPPTSQQEKPDAPSSPVSDPASEAWRSENNITILGDGCPAPFTSFSQAGFPDHINKTLATLKFSKPTPIQAQSWPLALGGRDMIGLAETGSGKTLAFILPAVIHILKKPADKRKGVSVLVLAPTRELAQQIEQVTNTVCGAARIKSCCVFGGMPKEPQARAARDAEVVIATPGRLIDLMHDEAVYLNNVSYLVLDEADRMLDMGFEIQINEIMRSVTYKPRQTLMFSATWPNDVQRLAQKFFVDPIRITIGSENLSGAKRVTQIVEVCPPSDRKRRLQQLLNQIFKDNCRILIFMLYKHSCKQMAEDLQNAGWPVAEIHGNLSQSARNKTLQDFKSGAKPIMIATDVAARGLDIKQVKYVINVEFPLKCEDYVHRIGRTGRAGETGTAYTFFSVEDKQHARELVQILEESQQNVSEEMKAIAHHAPGIKPKKTVMQEMYGDFAKGKDAALMSMKATRIVFDD